MRLDPAGVLLSVAWVAFKVGALSYGGGFVIIPLMQAAAGLIGGLLASVVAFSRARGKNPGI